MKRFSISVLLLALAFSLMAFRSAGAVQSTPCSSLVMGGSCVLESDETLPSGIVVMGGSAVLEEGSTVEGDVVIMGGNLTADGLIEGDLNLIGGNATLGSHSRVEGDVNTAGGNLDKRDGAVIEGAFNKNVPSPFPFVVPGRMEVPNWNNGSPSAPEIWSSPVATGMNLVWKFFWWLARSFLWAVLALIAMLLAPRHTERVALEAVSRPVESGGLGCLTVIVVPLILALLAITICGIPVTIVGAVLLVVAWGVGIIALGLELGKRLVHALKQDFAPAVTAALGTAVLTLAMNGVNSLVPCVGWILPAVVGSIGLGAVLLTRFGSVNTLPLPGFGSRPTPPAYSAAAPSTVGVYTPSEADIQTPMPPTRFVDEDLPPTVGVYDPENPNDPNL